MQHMWVSGCPVLAGALDDQATGHPQVVTSLPARGELDHDVFPAPADRLDPLAAQGVANRTPGGATAIFGR